jgi:hypothetical protein
MTLPGERARRIAAGETVEGTTAAERFEATVAICLRIAGPEGKEDVIRALRELLAQKEAEAAAKARADALAKAQAKAFADAHERGAIEGLRLNIATVLTARGLACSDDTRSKIATCTDASRLTRWLTRAATAHSEADVFADVDS